MVAVDEGDVRPVVVLKVTVAAEVRSAVLKVARAVRAGDVEAERAARSELVTLRLCRSVDEARRAGVRLSVEQGELVHGAVASVIDEERSR